MRYLLSFVSLLIAAVSFSQKNIYEISGMVKNISEGKVYLFSGGFNKKFYGQNDYIDSANIQKGEFKIMRKRKDNNIYAYRIFVRSDSINGVTGMVFIEPKNQFVVVDTLDEYVSPFIKNSATQNEMKFEYEAFFKSFVIKTDSLNNFSDELYKQFGKNLPNDVRIKFDHLEKNMILQGDSLFAQYIKDHSNSFVSLWKLIDRFNNFGYQKAYETLFNSLSNKIKNTSIAKLFSTDLINSKKLAVNSLFPKLRLKNITNQVEYLNPRNNKAQYTLIDFWFSNCGPCIRQFALYKKLFMLYNNPNLLNIIGISIDSQKNYYSWRKSIASNRLLWKQYLDEDGKWSSKVNITSFPTNFLLNRKGIIIQKDILPEELQNILTDMDNKKNYFDKVNSTLEPF